LPTSSNFAIIEPRCGFAADYFYRGCANPAGIKLTFDLHNFIFTTDTISEREERRNNIKKLEKNIDRVKEGGIFF
jgi:hypothetical protein